jgi:uncharacterized protein (DUF486 family)
MAREIRVNWPWEPTMPASLQTLILLTLSNVFMTFAWYAHLKNLSDKPWIIAALVSWGIALFEYPTRCRPIASAIPC